MRIASIMTLITLLVLLAFLAGGVLLQFFLCRRQSRWPGLVLPGLTFLYSLFAVLGVAVYEGMSPLEAAGALASVFLLCNIPTLVLLAIYFSCREKQKLEKQLKKMDIQDL